MKAGIYIKTDPCATFKILLILYIQTSLYCKSPGLLQILEYA